MSEHAAQRAELIGAGRPGRGEVAHGVHGEVTLGQDGAQDDAHLPCRADDGDQVGVGEVDRDPVAEGAEP